LLAASGSALGSLVIYAIGYAGGEELLRKRVSAERFEKLHNSFEKHPFWSLMFPAMLPPPTPFKAFVLAAAVAEMSISHFVIAIFLGRMVRFVILAVLVMQFGPGAIHVIRVFFSHHFHWLLLIAAAIIVVWLVVRKKRRARKVAQSGEHHNVS
jgi:membrane protein DedA with SNARE-associated domain